jgi:hypothetical protein
VDPNPDPGPDPGPRQTLKSLKVEFLHQNILYVGNRSKNMPTKLPGTKGLVKRQ